MAVLVRKKKGTDDWYCVGRAMGRRTSKKVATRKVGLALKKQWERELALGTFEWPGGGRSLHLSPYFRSFAEEFLEAARKRLKPNTTTGYENLIKLHLLRPWGKKCIRDIKKPQIKKLLLAKQEQGLNIQNLRICISAIFSFAVENDLLPINPAHNLGKGFRQNFVPKTPPQALCKAERNKFLALAEKKSEYYPFYLTLFKSGIRLGEALAMAVEDINWTTSQVLVQRNLSHHNWGTPKNNKTRTVNLSPQLVSVLHRACEKKRPVCQSSPDKVALIFSTRTGGPLNPDVVRIEFHKLLAEAGVRRIRLQDCRHTYASILLTAGASIFFVQKQLGHRSAELTTSTYGHLLREGKDTAALSD